MKLQILSADLNDELERSMGDLVSTLPRATSEIERVEVSVQSLERDLSQLTDRLLDIEQRTSEQVLSLEKLDLLKRNMEVSDPALPLLLLQSTSIPRNSQY